MKEITYKISIGENGKFVEHKEVQGFLVFEVYGYQWCAHKETEYDYEDSEIETWHLSELSTGCALDFGSASTCQEAAEKGINYLKAKGEAMVRHHVEKVRELLPQHV